MNLQDLNDPRLIVEYLNNRCAGCEEGQSVILRPFVLEDDGEFQRIKFAGTSLWCSDDGEHDPEEESLFVYVLRGAEAILSAFAAIDQDFKHLPPGINE